jgi:hypothetical protein
MLIGVLLRGLIGDMMDFGDVILRTLFPSFMTIQACIKFIWANLNLSGWLWRAMAAACGPTPGGPLPLSGRPAPATLLATQGVRQREAACAAQIEAPWGADTFGPELHVDERSELRRCLRSGLLGHTLSSCYS